MSTGAGRRWVSAAVIALFISHAGSFAQLTSQAWLGWEMTGSYSYLAKLGLVQASPLLGLPLIGGWIADRHDRRAVLLVTQATLAALALAMAIAAITGSITPNNLLLLAGLLAALVAVDNPVRQVYLPGVVSREERGRVVALNAVAYNAAAIIGPAFAGLLLATAGAEAAFLLNAASYLLLFIVLLGGPAAMPAVGDGQRTPVSMALRSQPELLRILASVALISLLGRSYVHVLPALVNDVWQAGEGVYGLLAAMPGAGALIAAAAIAWRGARDRPLRPARIAIITLAAALALVGLVTSPALAIVPLILVGVGATGAMTLLNAGLQLQAPDEVRGRVLSLYVWLAAGMPALGGFLLGNAMTNLSSRLVLLLTASLLLLLGLVTTSNRSTRKHADIN